MRTFLRGVAVVLTLCAGPAAAGTIDLSWNACFSNLPPSPTSTGVRTNPCVSNVGSATLVVSYYPSAEITKLVAVDAFVDYHLPAGIPCWWDFRPSNLLRGPALNVVTSDPSTCGPALNQTCFGCPGNYFFTARGASGGGGMALIDPSFGRISCTVGVPRGTGAAPLIGQEEFGFAIRIANLNTTTCAGCATPITLTLDHVVLYDSGKGTILASTYNHPEHRNRCTLNQGGAAKSKTWAAIRAIFRQ